MATLTIYLDDETRSAVEAAAAREGRSVSGWARGHLARAAKPEDGWPEGYFEMLGAAADDAEFRVPGKLPVRDVSFE